MFYRSSTAAHPPHAVFKERRDIGMDQPSKSLYAYTVYTYVHTYIDTPVCVGA